MNKNVQDKSKFEAALVYYNTIITYKSFRNFMIVKIINLQEEHVIKY